MRALIALCLLAAPLPAFAQAGTQTRREMSTDRPDKTESPYTVDEGRFQFELDFATYTRDRAEGVLDETYAIMPVNLKYGIGRDTDLQVIVEPYLRRIATDGRAGARDTTDGFGDVTVRLKHNLWGNDGGGTALGIMPFVRLPTNSADLGSRKAEFGVIVPLAIKLSESIDLGLMTEVDMVEDDDARSYRASFVNSATLGFSLTDRLGLYTELFTERGEDWIVTGDVGVTYALSDYTQIDFGANIGITRAADDLGIFAGLSRRF
ncbi:transporter [Sphingomonas sp.]|jgi:hypothetical protein|uniref:transporter n=1 Tax=Sphingomonas sp. TaxID=28214 RepID=UPI002EDAE03D